LWIRPGPWMTCENLFQGHLLRENRTLNLCRENQRVLRENQRVLRGRCRSLSLGWVSINRLLRNVGISCSPLPSATPGVFVVCRGLTCRTSGFRTLGTSLSRPFSSTKIQPLQTPPQLKSTSREMQDLPVTEGLSGTQSRQMVPLDLPTSAAGSRKIKRVDPRYLEMDAADLRISDVDPLVRELRRVVEALDALHGFEDS